MKNKNLLYISLFSPIFTGVVLFLILLGGFFFYHLSRVRSSDVQAYQELLISSAATNLNSVKKTYTAKQDRKNIQKDFLFYKQNNRLKMSLKADTAQLVLENQDFETRIIEHMQKVKCVMQEELYYLLPDGKEAIFHKNGKLVLRDADETKESSVVTIDKAQLIPMQIVRYMESDFAKYHYKGDLFEANDVLISRYSLKGHALANDIEDLGYQPKLLMKGKASKVEFILNSDAKDFNFKAHQLKASFFEARGL